MKKNLLRIGAMCMMLVAALTATAQGNVVATWDFTADPLGLSGGKVAGSTYTLEDNGVTLTIDATSGTVRDNSNSYQFYTGVVLRVPVTSAKDTVVVAGYPGYYSYSVNGVDATEQTTTHRATSAEVEQGYVEVVSTGDNNYYYYVSVTQVSSIQEKTIYSTEFDDDWEEINRKNNNETPTVVDLSTSYSHEDFTMTLCGVGVYPSEDDTKNGYTGYMESAKYTNEVTTQEPYVIVSELASVTKIELYQFATGGTRGWNVAAKGDGDEDWDTLYNQSIGTSAGEELSIDVNKTNCQIKFYSYNVAQNSYMDWLKIYGYVDMSSAPILGSFVANGVTYYAEDVFNETSDGNYEGEIEVSKTGTMISESNPLTDITAENGEIGTVTYTLDDDGECQVAIPVSYLGDSLTYFLNCVWKPDYTVTYYDADYETALGTQTVEKDAAIGEFAVDGSAVTVTDGDKFRGWQLDTYTGEKADEETVVTEDVSLYALVTDIEGDEANERNVYDLTDEFFYVEDHEGFIPNCTYSYNGSTHGLAMSNGNVQLIVTGNATLIIEACKYNGVAMTLATSAGSELATIDVPSTDGTKTTVSYTGEKDTLVLSFEGQIYLHSVTVINTGETTIAKNDAGYYVADAGSADSFWNILDMIDANEDGTDRVKIFLPNGTYDLGTEVEIDFPCNNISIIGQDMDSTIILTTPPTSIEGLGTADMFYNTKSYIYFQDLTLQNALDYYSAGSAGRAAVLQDRGNYTVGKNVKMLSYQDTYYSQSSSLKSYWETCDIHGTVDFICGGGDVRFQNTTISLEPRNESGSGSRTATAPNTNSNYGYVFDSCYVVDLAEGQGTWNLGRTWNNKPICVWLNTTLDENAENTLISSRWTEQGMNNTDPEVFGEYNTMDADGNNITPESNIISSYGGDFETILTADEAATYAYENMFTSWDPKALCQQVSVDTVTVSGTTVTWEAAGEATAYALFINNEFVDIVTTTTYTLSEELADDDDLTVRAANEMGGFGEAFSSVYGSSTGITSVTTSDDSDVISVDYYSVSGMRLNTMRQGINIRVKTMADGTKVTDKVIMK